MARKVADVVLGKVSRMYGEILRRLTLGNLDSERVVRSFQRIIEVEDDKVPEVPLGTRFIRLTAANRSEGAPLPSNILIEFKSMPSIWSPFNDWLGEGVAEGDRTKRAEALAIYEVLAESLPVSTLRMLQDVIQEKLPPSLF